MSAARASPLVAARSTRARSLSTPTASLTTSAIRCTSCLNAAAVAAAAEQAQSQRCSSRGTISARCSSLATSAVRGYRRAFSTNTRILAYPRKRFLVPAQPFEEASASSSTAEGSAAVGTGLRAATSTVEQAQADGSRSVSASEGKGDGSSGAPASSGGSGSGDSSSSKGDSSVPGGQDGSDGKGSSAGSGPGSGSGNSGAASGGSGGPSSSSSSGINNTSLSRQSVPDVYPQVLALPITRRPLFPGFYKAVVIKNPAVCAAIRESQRRGQPYVGAFLLKDQEEDSDVITDINKVHRTGVFCQVTSTFQASSSSPSINTSKRSGKEGTAEGGSGSGAAPVEEEGLTVVLYPHRRIKIDELITPHGLLSSDGKPAASELGDASPIKARVHGIQEEARGEGVLSNANGDGAHQDVDEAVNTTRQGEDTPAPAPHDEASAAASSSESAHTPSYQTSFLQDYAVSLVNVSNLEAQPYSKQSQVVRAVMAELISVFKDIATMNPLFRDQIANFSISQGAGNVFDEPEKLADFAAAVSSGEVGELQAVLEALNVEDRLQKALLVLKKELMNAQLQSKISKDVESKIQKRQREYYLMEQHKAIKKELGIESDGKDKMVEKFKEKAAELRMPEAVRKVFDEELSKLQTLEPAASEFNVTRGYLEWLTNIPWGVHSPENYSIANAAGVLDEDHYGLKDVKDRILEFLAVGKLRGSVEGKIICLVGPPGVGKTSIGKSIARAVQRQFFRFSVGGLSDVAEIKGHRRTYVGAMPGKAIQALKKVGTENPLILIDEVDKIGRGHNGDPSSALLEMLDPEQNGSFLDHYMDVPVNLSRVLFVCTANTLDTIPQPLLDRMEVIEVSSYTADEKRHIARNYLAPQAKDTSGLKDANVNLPDETIDFLIKHHARESGVRGLRKLLEKVYRKIAFNIVKEHGESVIPEPADETAPQGEVAATANKDAPVHNDTARAVGSIASDSQSVTSSSTPEDASSVQSSDRSEGDKPLAASQSSSSRTSASNGSEKPTETEEMDGMKAEVGTQARNTPPSPAPKVTTQQRKPMAVPPEVKVEITVESLHDYLGPPVYHKDRLYTKTMPAGVSTGLGYLGNGSGSLMPIETTIMPGKGGLQLTGKLGDVIKESASIALSWLKSHAHALGITKDEAENLLENKDVHLHMPEGAVGKDGPSAGVAFTTSLVSLLTGRTLPTTLAMTGEVSLRGMVLPVGGLKEKLLAAHRAGIKKVILPAQNQPNVEADVPKAVLNDLEVHYVHNVWAALDVAFGEGPWSARAQELKAEEEQEQPGPERV
ncbi:ATP-dependent protease La [Tilletiaria anomala UBC 951]|uniref:Lon protease homolog, mitochondrial n=1 Tax=Tilletiaria anomala (strain ATCC 24038 / CBS 436.72 / UBC 951) TaxID=1037660 RepID=A0A066WHZ3_TILAU|nr:ATP-dependent protease La [Tilletiaria anomala UBC 951]KDN52153.1 ATP-dependent protease La [Tilletiaria anomala UBC 951]